MNQSTINNYLRALAALLCAAAILLAGCAEAPVANAAKEDPMVLVREEYDGVYDYVVEYTYNPAGQLIRKVEREDQVTDYAYYSNGALKEEVMRIHDDRFNGNIRYSCEYREDGTLEKRVDNAYGSDGVQTGEEVIHYDEKGNPTSSTWKVYNKVVNSNKTVVGKTWETTYENTYDGEGRLIGCFQINSDTGEMVEETWWYGGNGEITHRRDYIIGGRLSYRETTATNADGNLLTYLWESSDGYPKHKARHCLYDDQGNLIYEEYSENDIAGAASMGTIVGSTTHYTNVYSKEGLLTQTLKTSSSYYYNGVSMETTVVPSHTSVLYTYDSEGRILSESFKDEHGNELFTNKWTYDAKGNVTRREDIEVGIITYTYAGLSTLKTK